MALQLIKEKANISTKIKTIIAIGAGKGGVGKSTVTVNLALALKKAGKGVGILDADIYGPSLVQMLPEGLQPIEEDGVIVPAMSMGIPFISVAHFQKNVSVVRAPVANSIIDQFLHSVDWGELDFLLIDFPPGTGDIQITLMQKGFINAAIVVTTPQIVSLIDVRKAIQMFEKMHIPVLGIVENMSYFIEPKSKEKMTLFGKGGAQKLGEEFCLPILGMIPLDPLFSEAGDQGFSIFEQNPDCVGAAIFQSIAEEIVIKNSSLIIPKVDVRQMDPHRLIFKYNEEEPFILTLSEIQKMCPCARCQGAFEKKLDAQVSLLEFSLIGRYALRVQFTSGCSSGLYPFSLIKKIAQK